MKNVKKISKNKAKKLYEAGFHVAVKSARIPDYSHGGVSALRWLDLASVNWDFDAQLEDFIFYNGTKVLFYALEGEKI